MSTKSRYTLVFAHVPFIVFAPQKVHTAQWEIFTFFPSSIYSWSKDHILEHEFFCLGRLGSQGNKGKKWIWGILSNFWGWFFQLFVGKKIF